jgi:hypothetical protein
MHATSNDTYYTNGSLWGMYSGSSSPANQFGSQAAAAWAAGHTSCGNVIVGVIDEGIMFTHDDLSSNIWVNPYDAADGSDNDGNGYVDDIRGWNFVDNNNQIYKAGADSHGTHVAGTIGGIGGNGKGVAGVCWSGIKMISGKFLGSNGGTTANAIKAIDYMTDLKTRHNLNLVATNNSWGGGGFSQALQDAITRAGNANILFIAAAGNSGADNDTTPELSGELSQQQHHRGRVDHLQRRDVELLPVRRELGRHLRARLGDLVDGAGAPEGQVRVRLRQLQRHLDGRAPRRRRGGAVQVHPFERQRGRRQERDHGQCNDDRLVQWQGGQQRAPERHRLLIGKRVPGRARRLPGPAFFAAPARIACPRRRAPTA